MAKSALEKLSIVKAPKIVRELLPGVSWAPPGSSMVVSTPREVDSFMRRVPEGRITTLDALRDAIAEAHGTTIACPVSTGMFVTIAARAAEETRERRGADVTPWWRTLKADGFLNVKMPGGIGRQRALLEDDGLTIERKGQHFRVKDWDRLQFDFAQSV